MFNYIFLLAFLPLTLFAQAPAKPAAAPGYDVQIDGVPMDMKELKGTIVEFKPPYKYMQVLVEGDEDGRFSNVLVTDSTWFPRRHVQYSKTVRKPTKPENLQKSSQYRPGMEVKLHVSHYQRSLRNVAKEIYLDEDYYGKAKVSGIFEFYDGNKAVIDGQTVIMEPNAVIKGTDEWKNMTFKSFSEIQPGSEITVKGRRDTTGIVYIKEGTNCPIKIGKDDLLMRRAVNKALWVNKNVLQIGKDVRYDFVMDRAMFAYVNDIGQKLIPSYLKTLKDDHPDFINFKFYLVHDNSFNASAYPNGAVIIHTGLLKQLDNEAQLAAILGHEIAHVTQRHHTHSYSKGKDWQALADFGSLVGGYAYGTDLPGQIAQSVKDMYHSSYNRTQETQADRIGLQYMYNAGYDPREAAIIWGKLALEDKHDEESPEEAKALAALNANSVAVTRQDNTARATRLALFGSALNYSSSAMVMSLAKNVASKAGESVYASHPRSRDRFNHVNFLLSTAYASYSFDKTVAETPEFTKFKNQLNSSGTSTAPNITSTATSQTPPKSLKPGQTRPGGKTLVAPKASKKK
ncbi:M48 family metallopeptidase [Spirosoma linguale]